MRKEGAMQIVSTYFARIEDRQLYRVFSDTARVYNDAVSYLIGVIDSEWASYGALTCATESTNVTEALVHHTENNKTPKYADFDTRFYKFPCYLRRSAIAEAYGKVKAYRSLLANWEALPEDERKDGKGKPGFPKAGNDFPALYKGNMFMRLDARTVKVKVFIRNTWDWVVLHLRKCDCDYISHHCTWRKECNPTMQKRWKYGRWTSRTRLTASCAKRNSLSGPP